MIAEIKIIKCKNENIKLNKCLWKFNQKTMRLIIREKIREVQPLSSSRSQLKESKVKEENYEKKQEYFL